jgi:uncharacterized DUF497 family protein
MEFEWDPNKSRANLAKHGIDFATAALVFADPKVKLSEDRIDETGEPRWHALGMAGGLEPLLIVVHVCRESSHGEEVIRIISARKALARESRTYFE